MQLSSAGFCPIDSDCLVFPSFQLYFLNSERPIETHLSSSSSHCSLKILSKKWVGGLPFLFPITQRSLFLIALIICHHLFHLFLSRRRINPVPVTSSWLQVDVSQLWFLTHSSTHYKQFVLFSVNLVSIFAI